jgi:MinD superfamily P-loop ATPase
MKVAIASGKGGTGKTTIAACLAVAAATRGRSVVYVDCDVEAPNGHLLLQPTVDESRPVASLIPVIDLDKCARCGVCERVCEFGAITCLGPVVQVQANLCKSCGACVSACPRKAISETPQTIGRVEIGSAGPVSCVQGVLDVGQPRAIPVIEAARGAANGAGDLQILDAPPGSSCPMVATVSGVDLILLVTDATPFGLADLEVALQTVRLLNIPTAVVVNRSDLGDRQVYAFCETQGLPVYAEFPYSHAAAQAYSQGDLTALISQLDDPLAALLDHIANKQIGRAS